VLSLFLFYFSCAQTIEKQEYLIKVSDTFIENYSSIPESQKEKFINNYFDNGELSKIKPVIEKKEKPLKSWFRISVNKNIRKELDKFKNQNKIVEFQNNNVLKINSIPNDSLFHKQWYLQKIHAVDSWGNYVELEKIILAPFSIAYTIASATSSSSRYPLAVPALKFITFNPGTLPEIPIALFV